MPSESASRYFSRTDVHAALTRHFQQRLAGHARAMLYLIRDYIATFCMEDERGWFTEAVKREVTTLNELAHPWILLLGKITMHKRLRQVADIRTQTHMRDEPTGPVVYARVNTETNDMYVGETKAWENRVKQHFVATCRHRHGAANPCKACREHIKYKKHRAASPGAWITIPLMEMREKYEARRGERKLIRELKPNLNAADRPFWLLKDQYVAVYKTTRLKKTGEKPWSDKAVTAHGAALPFFTTYKFEGSEYYDFAMILSFLADKGTAGRVQLVPGKFDLTRWSRVRERFGGSKLRTHGDEPYDGILHDWRKEHGAETELFVRAHVTEPSPPEQTWKDIASFQEHLQQADEDALAFLWRMRKEPAVLAEERSKFKVRSMIWAELESRYEGLSRTPITVRIPFFKQLRPDLFRGEIHAKIEAQPWPDYIVEWHKQRLRIVTESQPAIEEILCNVTKPWMPQQCKCEEIKRTLQAKDANVALPELEGHLFFISRDYRGPNEAALKVSGNNVPLQTNWDLARAWKKVRAQLPSEMQGEEKDWEKLLKKCAPVTQKSFAFTTTRDVYTLRKNLDGLVCGQLDKNLHELWFCCPCLYKKAWEKTYGEPNGYERVYPRKDTARMKKTPQDIYAATEPAARSAGTDKDIIKAWGRLYRQKQWHRYAAYNRKGGFNLPYVLFKAKNIVDHEVRKEKWMKARPIAPATRHPMKALFHKTGRAWSYITNNLQCNNFVIPHGGKVPEFFDEVERELAPLGRLRAIVRDVTGCFPNMDKEAIRFALRAELMRITEKTGFDSVSIPRKSTRPCSLKPFKGGTTIPFEDLLDIMEFALDNTLLRDFEGNLWRQAMGIPMGDPHSPGMTIGTCAWMEHEWLESLDEATKKLFKIKRYMDDLLIFTAENATWDRDGFEKSIGEECYFPPLSLEDGSEGTFLETRFRITATNRIRHWLKNTNELGDEPTVWRYAHFASYAPFVQKKAVLMATLRKVQAMASDDRALSKSGIQKIAEFARLRYPKKMLWTACTTMGVSTRCTAWFRVRDALPSL